MMTLECMLARWVVEVRRGATEERKGAGGIVGIWAVDGEVCGRNEAVAARVRLRLERRGGEAKRRKLEENRMKVKRGTGFVEL